MYVRGASFDSRRREIRRRRGTILYFFIGAFVAGGILSGLWSIPRYPQTAIEEISVSGNHAVSAEAIKAAAQRALTGSFYVFFPKRNIFWYPKGEIEKSVLAVDPQISSASVSLQGRGNILVEVKERVPAALLCAEKTDENTISQCLFVDEDGFAFAPTPNFSGNIYTRFFATTSKLLIGGQFIPPPDFRAIISFSGELRKNGLPVSAVLVGEDSTRLRLERGGDLIVSQGQNFGSAMENLTALLQSKEFKGRGEGGLVQFEYIDLRFGNKLFYKI